MQTNELKDFESLDPGDLFEFQSRVYRKRDLRTAVVICADGESGCGMSLEPKSANVGDEDNSELTDMTRRLWIGGLLTLPVFFLAMLHLVPIATLQTIGDSHLSRWVQFA